MFLLAIVAPSLSQYSGDPIKAETNFIKKWHGEFIGVVDIPLEDDIVEWRMTITFPKNVFDFEICGAKVTEVENKRVFHLKNSRWNGRHSAGSNLYFTFNAKTWKKIRGLPGKVLFWPTIAATPGPPTEEPSEMEESSSAMGYDNGLTECIGTPLNDVSLNNTCGSSFELISSSPSITVSEVQLPVDFGDEDDVTVTITSTEVLSWFALDFDFQMCLTLDDDSTIDIEASLSVVSTQIRILTIPMKADIMDQSGRLKLRFRYPGSSVGAILFPFEDTSRECPCRRLKYYDESQN